MHGLIAVTPGVGDDDGQKEADVDLIIRAVNHHYESVAALNELLEICQWKCSPLDEIVIKSRKSNHQVMIEASRLLASIAAG
jgi:hypothetical protein